MTDETSPPNSGDQSGDLEATLERLAAAAISVRRLDSQDQRTADGLLAVCHRGDDGGVEMLSWEDETGEVVRQDLIIEDRRIQIHHPGGLRTAKIESHETIPTGAAKIDTTPEEMDAVADPETLELAAHLLKNITDRDQYAQSFLRAVNLTISELAYDNEQTAVAKARASARQAEGRTVPITPEDIKQQYKARTQADRQRELGRELDQTKLLPVRQHGSGLVILLAFALALAGVGLGLIVSYFLGVL